MRNAPRHRVRYRHRGPLVTGMTLYERWEGRWGFQRPTVIRNPQSGKWIAYRPDAVSLRFDTFAEAIEYATGGAA